jgi:hypothetical protein
MSPLVNINFNDQIFPRNFAAHLAQSSSSGPWPKRVELFWTEPDLAFFAVSTTAHLESQRCSRAFFAETDLSACGFTRQITLIDNVAPRAIQLIRQPPKQKFAFNFPIICCSRIFLHKANMLNATSLLSRFSRWLLLTPCFSEVHSSREGEKPLPAVCFARPIRRKPLKRL